MEKTGRYFPSVLGALLPYYGTFVSYLWRSNPDSLEPYSCQVQPLGWQRVKQEDRWQEYRKSGALGVGLSGLLASEPKRKKPKKKNALEPGGKYAQNLFFPGEGIPVITVLRAGHLIFPAPCDANKGVVALRRI